MAACHLRACIEFKERLPAKQQRNSFPTAKEQLIATRFATRLSSTLAHGQAGHRHTAGRLRRIGGPTSCFYMAQYQNIIGIYNTLGSRLCAFTNPFCENTDFRTALQSLASWSARTPFFKPFSIALRCGSSIVVHAVSAWAKIV